MSEKILQEIPGNDAKKDGDSINFIRHSKAEYNTYGKIRSSENPQAGMDPENQITPDLSAEGVALAEKKAEELLSRFVADRDILFFTSSNEARALETANVYRKKAHEKGFEILKPDNVRLKLAETIGEGEIRVIDNLSLNPKNILLQALFNPDHHNVSVNWDALDQETREKCDRVRALVRENDYGSFGPNFFHHSEKAKKIFPEIKSAQDQFDSQFQHLLRLARFGLKMAGDAKLAKNVKILAFGHENYMAYALDKYFGDNEIKNCEAIEVRFDDGHVRMDRRGISKILPGAGTADDKVD